MPFNEVLNQTTAMLQQHGRVSYRALKRQFALDDAVLEDLKYELIEVQQCLVETGVLVGERGEYRLAKPLASLQVPATIHAVLAARIDWLSPEEKHLLQTVAVIGTEVPLPLLQATAELPEAALHRSLVRLQAAEFLYETRLFPKYAYTLHALTHPEARPGPCASSARLWREPPEAEQAETYYRHALALADELGMRPLQAHRHRGLGSLYAATGQRDQARAALEPAIELYRAMDMAFWLPQAQAALTQLEGR